MKAERKNTREGRENFKLSKKTEVVKGGSLRE